MSEPRLIVPGEPWPEAEEGRRWRCVAEGLAPGYVVADDWIQAGLCYRRACGLSDEAGVRVVEVGR